MADISKININDIPYSIKDAQNRQDLTSLSTEVQSISINLNSLSTSISTNYLPLSGGTLTGQLNIDLNDTFIKLIANNVDATTTSDSNKYENIKFLDKNNLQLSGIETTYRTNKTVDIKLTATNQISGGSNYFLIGRTAEGENTYEVADPAMFVKDVLDGNVVYHVTASIPSGSTKTFYADEITAKMRVVNCVFGTPANVTSNVSWTTADGSITFTGTFTGATTVNFDLVESNSITVS